MVVDKFFSRPAQPRKRRRAEKPPERDEEITSESDKGSDSESESIAETESSESDHETAADKRRRLAKDYLDSIAAEKEASEAAGFNAEDLDREIISRRLKDDAAETHGRIFRDLQGAQVKEIHRSKTAARNLIGVAATWPWGFTVGKTLTLQKWDLTTLAVEKTIRDHHDRDSVTCIAANSEFVVTGGRDRRICVYTVSNLSLVHTFYLNQYKAEVLCMVFRQGTSELYVGCADLRLRTYDLSQMAFVETLYGHQDHITSVAALSQPRCVSAGSRDRTVIYWKIPEEARLTFRGGDTKLAAQNPGPEVTLEGSIDCCAMLDNQFFVSGSDNGNVSLWSTQRKKPVAIEREAHGMNPPLSPSQASAETDPSRVEVPPPQPRGITSLASVPYSNVFVTGSWVGTVRVWCVSEDRRSFSLLNEVKVGKGIVTGLAAVESQENRNEFVIFASLSREPRLGRWMKVSGGDAVGTFTLKI